MAQRIFPYIAMMLLYAFTPGLCELAEIAVHLVDKGDLHASDEDRHAEHGDEGDTEGECHTCVCHAPTAFLVSPTKTAQDVALAKSDLMLFAHDDAVIGGAIRELYRPPIS